MAIEHPSALPDSIPYDAEGYMQEATIVSATPMQLVLLRFRKHKLAVISTYVIIALYLVALFPEFLAPYSLQRRFNDFVFAPPQPVHLFHEGEWQGPFVYGRGMELNLDTLRREYVEDESQIHPIRFFVKGEPYRMFGLFPMDRHLFGTTSEYPIVLFGTDRLGRDVLSRMIYGTRISLSIGLIGIFLSFMLGLLIGGAAGYFGGVLDEITQRSIEILRSFPTIPLWLALAAALPARWSPLLIYFGITVVLSLLGWTGLARVTRGKLLSLRDEDYVTAARLSGGKSWYIIWQHLIPGFLSYIIVSLTLAIPGMILGETSLSFLGLGLRPPITSWGVLLAEAQNVNIVALYPWLLIPAIPVVVTVLAFNFAGDGLRDAADPYSK